MARERTTKPAPSKSKAPTIQRTEPARNSLSALRRRSPKTSERVARDLANYIVESDLAVGTMLPTEKELIAQLQVGRTTLREALRLLETRGVLTIRSGPGGGPVVRRPEPSDLGEALSLILLFEHATLAEVTEARQAFEPLVARLATPRIGDAELATLTDINDQMAEHVANSDSRPLLELNERFHHTISRAAGNVVLEIFVEALLTIFDNALMGYPYPPERRRKVVREHEAIIAAFREGDEEKVVEAVTAHAHSATRLWQSRQPEILTRPLRWIQ